jgi:hypothetical protein
VKAYVVQWEGIYESRECISIWTTRELAETEIHRLIGRPARYHSDYSVREVEIDAKAD